MPQPLRPSPLYRLGFTRAIEVAQVDEHPAPALQERDVVTVDELARSMRGWERAEFGEFLHRDQLAAADVQELAQLVRGVERARGLLLARCRRLEAALH